MTIHDLIFLSMFALLGYFVWQHLDISMKAKEKALDYTEKQNLILLDQSVILASIKPVRTKHRFYCLKRLYRFEFSSIGDRRYQGQLSYLGAHFDSIELQAYRIEE